MTDYVPMILGSQKTSHKETFDEVKTGQDRISPWADVLSDGAWDQRVLVGKWLQACIGSRIASSLSP